MDFADLWLNPALIFGLLLSAAYAALFHLWTGKNLRNLVVYLLAAMLGFGAGQWAGQMMQLDLLRIGQLYLLETGLGALLALLLVRTLNL
jgi:hypothetical protein